MIEKNYQKIREANRAYFPRFSDKEYKERHRKIRLEMEERKLDCLLIYGHSALNSRAQANVRWVSNFWDFFQSYIVFPLVGELTLFVSAPHFLLAMTMSIIEDVRHGGGDIAATVADRIKDLHLEKKNIGICGGDIRLCNSIPYDHYTTLQKNLPDAKFHGATDLIQDLRHIPSEEEMKWFEKGVDLTNYAMQCLIDAIRPGVDGHELYGAVHRHCDKGGLPLFALLGSTSMSNPALPYPWFYPSTRRLEKGDVVIAELSADYWGYAGQMCRTIALGEPTKEYKNLYSVALEVYTGIREVLKPGNGPEEVLKITAKIPKAGYTIYSPAIHGWGMTVSPPRYIGIPEIQTFGIGMKSMEQEYKFQNNELLMIEPNPCSQDICQGVFIGDVHRVTPEGGIPLHKFPIDFKVVD